MGADPMTDAEALDQIAALLGLHATDPANNPVDLVLNDIICYVAETGRRTDEAEGA